MSNSTRFVGLDVHKATIAVATAEPDGSVLEHGVIPNDPSSVRKLAKRLAPAGIELKIAYEAGPTGYARTARSPVWAWTVWWWLHR